MIHEHHQWLADLNRSIVESYEREQEMARQAANIQEVGHAVESVWDEVITEWLPPQYHIGKRKYIMLETEDGPAKTGEVDLVIFHPHYPESLRKKPRVLASGVAAAFSVKRTITRKAVLEAYDEAAVIARGMKIREGTPRDILAPPLFYGLLGESSEWKSDEQKEKLKILIDKSDKLVEVPRDGLDMLCIADLGNWVRSTSIVKQEIFQGLKMPDSFLGQVPPEITDLMSGGDIIMSGLRHKYDDPEPLSPLTQFIGSLWWKLSINDPTIRPLADGLKFTKTYPEEGSLAFKWWKLKDLMNEHIAGSVRRGFIPNADWQYLF